ncbi:hypothetical protein Halhy_5270 [Haliscomenobacter hydrossis DSM 1100]|uniref:Uncharacterized protein n=1 Tax=Haliscomenobacter hydrossis (strain ATCC 27775 / DSM 1100 / LMG 10767 / O) TaxID=760192 RepID=F4L635_HALH1|nr:hypothetical protein Halhy_5270 [Haliscomenobacter hydrossis DSM 1100]
MKTRSLNLKFFNALKRDKVQLRNGITLVNVSSELTSNIVRLLRSRNH